MIPFEILSPSLKKKYTKVGIINNNNKFSAIDTIFDKKFDTITIRASLNLS